MSSLEIFLSINDVSNIEYTKRKTEYDGSDGPNILTSSVRCLLLLTPHPPPPTEQLAI